MKTITILGDNGMLGHMVLLYLKQFYKIKIIKHRWPTQEFKDSIVNLKSDFLINCIGAIPQRNNTFDVNTELPIWLDSNFKGNIIHPGTDCEIDNDEYGTSKRLSSTWILNNGINTKIIKTSIIGPELHSNASLMSWFLSNKDNTLVNGFTDHFWNGSTTLQWAKHANVMINDWESQPKLTIIGSDCISKFNILNTIKSVYNKNIDINSFNSNKLTNKCMDLDIKYESIEKQLIDLKLFYEKK